MKKILALILVMIMTLSMAACSGTPADDTTESGETTEIVGTATEETTITEATEEETAAEATEPDEVSGEITVVGEGATAFSLSIVNLDGSETKYEVHTDETIVGAALLDLGLIEGDESTYGLYITAVNGIAADWNADQTYWAFHIDGEYAITGVDATEIDTDAAYSLVLTKG